MANWKEATERWLPIVEHMEEHSMDDYAIPEIYRAAEKAIDALKRENEELRERNNQATYCAYCGEDFPLDTEHTTLQVGIHIWECEEHPLNVLCRNIEERCKDLDMDAQEHLERENVQHASGIHKAIDKIREEIDAGKQSCQRMRDTLLTKETNDG